MAWSPNGYATKKDTDEWIACAQKQNAKYLMIVNDTFSYEDYPVYAKTLEELRLLYDKYNYKNMQDIMSIIEIKVGPTPSETTAKVIPINDYASVMSFAPAAPTLERR